VNCAAPPAFVRAWNDARNDARNVLRVALRVRGARESDVECFEKVAIYRRLAR